MRESPEGCATYKHANVYALIHAAHVSREIQSIKKRGHTLLVTPLSLTAWCVTAPLGVT